MRNYSVRKYARSHRASDRSFVPLEHCVVVLQDASKQNSTKQDNQNHFDGVDVTADADEMLISLAERECQNLSGCEQN